MCTGERRTLLYCGRCQRLVDEQVDPPRPCRFVREHRAAWCRTHAQAPNTVLLREPCRPCRESELQQAHAGFHTNQRQPAETAPPLVNSEETAFNSLPGNRFGHQQAPYNHHDTRRPQSAGSSTEAVAGSSDSSVRPTATIPARENTPVDDEATRQAIMRDLRNRRVLSREQQRSPNYQRLIRAATPAFLAGDQAGYESVVAFFVEAMGPAPAQAEVSSSHPAQGHPDLVPISPSRGRDTRRNTFGPGSHVTMRDSSGRMCDVRTKTRPSTRKR